MSPMNLLSIDNTQATEINAVSSDSSLGPWNKSSDKFADVISQHQTAHSGKSEPKGGKNTGSSVSSSKKPEQSITSATQPSDKPADSSVLKAQENAKERDENTNDEIAAAQGNSSESLTEASNVNLQSKEIVTQQVNKNTEHLKLLAMLEAADKVSTEHNNSPDNPLSSTEQSTLVKMLAGIEHLSQQELSKLKDRFAKADGDKVATLAIKQLESLMKGNPPEAVGQTEKKASPTSDMLAKLDTTLVQSGDDIIAEQSEANNAKADATHDIINKEKLTAQTTAAIEQTQTNSHANGKVSHAAVTEKLASEETATKSTKATGVDKNIDNNRQKVASMRNNQPTNQELSQQEKSPQLVDVGGNLAIKFSENGKDIAASNNSLIKENSAGLTSLSSSQQFSQHHSENKAQSSQEKHTNTAKAEMKNNNAEVGLAKSTSDSNGSQHTEQEMVADIKHSLSITTTKEASAFKPVDINPHNNILSTSFVQAEEQAAAHVIEKAANDTVDAMTQKKTLNLHNETIAIYRKDFNLAVKDKVMVMISQKLQQVDIRLDPPELGSMHVKVNLQNEQAVVSFMVQNQQAKDALEQNMGKLRDMLAQNGVDVGDANVEQQQQKASDQQGESGRNRQAEPGNSTEQNEQQAFIANANLYKASATGIDYYA